MCVFVYGGRKMDKKHVTRMNKRLERVKMVQMVSVSLSLCAIKCEAIVNIHVA